MKKINFKTVAIVLVLCYTHYAAYTRFKYVGQHFQNLMEWVGVAAEEGGKVAAGLTK